MKPLLFAAMVLGASAAHAQPLKGLSIEEVDQYLSGAGMGFAKAAELNHFPGPMHVLELGERLGFETIDRPTLAEGVRRASALQGEYRLSHLEIHRRMRALLTAEQVKRYDELRGYTSERPTHPHRH